MEAIVVPCTQEKIWDARPDAGAVAAKDAYVKPAFLTWRKHAEQSGSPWFILSTKYGLLRPDERIERYNVPVSSAARSQSFLKLLGDQGKALGLDKLDQVVLLDWEKFKPLVRAAIPDRKVKCVLRKILY